MDKPKKINISKQIIIEKCNFISNNSTYFKRNLHDNLGILKDILLNNAPLAKCEGYEDLISEIKKDKIKNNIDASYQYSMETLFAIVYSILRNTFASEDSKKEQIEKIRQYVKCISTQSSGKIYYHKQKIVAIDNEQLIGIEKEIKLEKKKKTYKKDYK